MADRLKWEGGNRAGSPLGTIYYYILQLVFKVFCAEDIFLNVLVLLRDTGWSIQYIFVRFELIVWRRVRILPDGGIILLLFCFLVCEVFVFVILLCTSLSKLQISYGKIQRTSFLVYKEFLLTKSFKVTTSFL